MIAQILGVDKGARSSRTKLIDNLCKKAYHGEHEDVIKAATKEAHENDRSKKASKRTVDPLTETCLKDLSVDDRKEFAMCAKEIAANEAKRKIAGWKARQKHQQTPQKKRKARHEDAPSAPKFAGVSQASAKSKAKVKAKANAASSAGEGGGEGDGAGACAASRSFYGRSTEGNFTWENSKGLKFTFTQLNRKSVETGWSVMCHKHKKTNAKR